MNITIINGIKDTVVNPFQEKMELACKKFTDEHEVDLFTIEKMDINYCCGCFGCWVKNPGECIYKDDMDEVLTSIIKTDLLLVVSPLDAGFITSLAKKALDRIIPTALPFIRVYDGECHHVPRYEKHGGLGIIILDDGNVDGEAQSIAYESFDRLAKNFHSQKVIKATANMENLTEVLQNEISGC